MGNPTLVKNVVAETALTKYRIAKFGSADGQAVPAAAATDALMGVTTDVDTAAGARADLVIAGLADVEFGGTVTRGGEVTSDANGKAVAAAPGAGVNNRIIGFAWVSAVAGDIAPILVAPGKVQG